LRDLPRAGAGMDNVCEATSFIEITLTEPALSDRFSRLKEVDNVLDSRVVAISHQFHWRTSFAGIVRTAQPGGDEILLHHTRQTLKNLPDALNLLLVGGIRGSERVIWPLFVLAFGLPGWVGYRFGRRWPVLESCPKCGVDVPRDREDCTDCEVAFPGPALKGTEVFA
jgi:hypothetical protein